MIGFRYRVGGDWALYRDTFHHIQNLGFLKALVLPNSDPGYSALNWLVGKAGLGIWAVNLVCGAILVWGIARIAVRQPIPWLVFAAAVPYLIIVVGMGYTRQAAAIGFSLVAICAFLEGNLRSFFLWMIAATAFHKSAIVLLPIIGLTMSENRLLTIACTVLIALMLYYFFVSARIESLATNYLQAQLESEGAPVRVAMSAVPAVLFLAAQRRFGFAEHERLVWRNLALAALACVGALLLLASSTVVDRLALYLIVLQLVILGRLPVAYGGHVGGRLVLTMLVIVYAGLIQFVWLNYATNARMWVPYQIYPLI